MVETLTELLKRPFPLLGRQTSLVKTDNSKVISFLKAATGQIKRHSSEVERACKRCDELITNGSKHRIEDMTEMLDHFKDLEEELEKMIGKLRYELYLLSNACKAIADDFGGDKKWQT